MKRIFLIIFLITISFMTLPLKVYTAEEAEEIILYLGEVKILSVDNPKRIAIANPNIVDVTNVSKNEITLSPKAVGATTLVLWDNFGEQSYRVKVFAEDISEIKQRIDNLLRKLNLTTVYTEAEEEEGRVLLLGSVKTPQDKERITTVLGALRDKTADLVVIKEEEAVVEIDVQILELNRDATATLGFTWPAALNLIEKNSPGISGGVKASTLFKVLNLQRGTSAAATPWNFKLDALIQEGKARILSRPRLACQSGKEAELLVGGEKPIFTTEVAGTTGGEGTTVDYKEYGIKLKIKPTVVEDERIKLALNVEVSEVGTAETIGSETTTTAKAYPLTKRNASTELYLNNGQSMAIGGLIKQKTEEDLRKFPWLADIPVLGLFFRQKTTKIGGGQGERGNTELFILITPTIISPKRDMREVSSEIKPGVSSGSIENISTPLARYASIVQKRILEKMTYPALAKEAGYQGTVKISLHLSFRGELLEAKIKDSSGYNILDENTLRIAKEISSYPPFPPSIEPKELWVDIPVVYKLD